MYDQVKCFIGVRSIWLYFVENIDFFCVTACCRKSSSIPEGLYNKCDFSRLPVGDSLLVFQKWASSFEQARRDAGRERGCVSSWAQNVHAVQTEQLWRRSQKLFTHIQRQRPGVVAGQLQSVCWCCSARPRTKTKTRCESRPQHRGGTPGRTVSTVLQGGCGRNTNRCLKEAGPETLL